MRGEQEHLADEFFKKTKDQAVDFEITLAALLGTACLAYPLQQHWMSQIVAFGLLSVTLIRRIAIASPFAEEEKIMRYTTRIVEFFTTLAILSLLVVLSTEVHSKLEIGTLLQTFSFLTIGVFLILVVVQELTFRDYFVWWTAKFQEKRQNADYLEGFWQDMEEISYLFATARQNRDSWKKIPSNVKNNLPDLSDFELEPKEYAKLIFRTMFILGLIYAIPIGYSIWALGFSGLLVVPAVVAVHDHSCFWYIAYGNTSYEEFRKHIPEIILWTIIYTTTVTLFSNYSAFVEILPF